MKIVNQKYLDIISENRRLSKQLVNNNIQIVILSNIIVNQIKEILEYQLRTEGINANVEFGDYDNIVQDSIKYNDSSAILIFWELCNIIEGLQYKIELLNDNDFNAIIEKTKLEIDLVLKNLRKTSLVLINKFTSIHFSNSNIRKNNLDRISNILNNYLEKKIYSNVILCNLEKVICNVGVDKSLDLRYYYSSKALYTIDFFKAYGEYVKPLFISANGKAKKALIFDCDNTLWKGILGEDGFNNIEMSIDTKNGLIFHEIQSIALALNKAGVLIGLCTKNNPEDIDEVIKTHPDMLLRDEHIAIVKSNWLDKVSNLKKIADELNIGLESLVVIDDSSFEVNFIRKELPMVTILQVPERLYKYPRMLRENMGLFFNLSFTDEDKIKIKMYKQQKKRENVRKEFTDIDDYLSSLGLKMTIYKDNEDIIPRMSQMSQKTNQFNLTTKRYTEGDIKNYLEDTNSNVYAFSVEDKYGESGITGLSIVNMVSDVKSAEIDTFLMSCRIIGRNIEYVFIDHIIGIIKKRKIDIVKATYIKTLKNDLVKEFYDNCTFSLLESTDSLKNYALDTRNYKPKKINYIEVINE